MTRSAPSSSVYDEDFFTWTQNQAVALRRLGERGDIDVEHLAEEIEDLGKRDLREVTSFLELLLSHLMKAAANPKASSAAHWLVEARAFRRAARKAFTPGMRRLIRLHDLWQEAADNLAEDRGQTGLLLPPKQPCPFELNELLAKDFDIDLAVAKIQGVIG